MNYQGERMMKKILLSAAVAAACLIACNRTQPEGPAERAGRHIDNAADEIHDDAVRSGHNAKSAINDVKRRLSSEGDPQPSTDDRYDR